MSKSQKGRVVVRSAAGDPVSFGRFLEEQRAEAGLPVNRFASSIGVSRAAYYLLRNDTQVPSLSTVAAALAALDFRDIRVSSVTRVGQEPSAFDLQAAKDGREYEFCWPWSEAERRRAHEKYLATAGIAAAGLGVGMAGAVGAVLPAFGPAALAAALAARARSKATERSRKGSPARTTTQGELVTEVRAVAQTMSPEALEVVLETLKEMRRHQGEPRDY